MADETLIHAVFDDNPVPMWRCDAATRRLVAVNEAVVRTYGYSRAELLGMTVSHLEASAPAGEPPSKIHRHLHKTGSPLFVELSRHELAGPDGPQELVTVVDVTERELAREALRKLESRLTHASKMDAIGRLASGVAHDFNNLLMVVQASAYILEETVAPDSPEALEVTEILRAVDRATTLTRQLLVMSRQSATAPKLVRLDELVGKLVPALGRLIGPGVAIAVTGGAVPAVMADPGQLEQVVMNLAVNARDAMEGNGRLTLETTVEHLDGESAALIGLKEGAYVKLSVADTGPGIDRETQKRIFDPFFTTKAAGRGTGLGLSIVHGILAQAGGGIDVYSEKGYGTSFHVRVPVAEGVEQVVAMPMKAPPRRLRPSTVLFVDPLAELRRVMVRTLEGMGCTVIEAATASEARDACVQHDGPIHVAVIDATLPDGHGLELARVLGELRPEMRALLMSGFPAGTLAGSGDAVELLAKPFTPGALRDAIGALVADAAPSRVSEPRMQSKVLIVDDDPTLRKMLVRMLKRAGFDVGDADSGRHAMSLLGKERFDVVISDIHMADGDGLELLRAVRRIDLDVPVVLMSGKPDVATAATALEYGAFRYLTKPLENEAVERVVKQAARAHALARLRREAVRVGGGQSGAGDRAGLEVRFDQALDGLWMAFQPIVEAATGRVFGMEALMRSREPSIMGPGPLLEAATALGRLPALGRRTRQLAGAAIGERPDVPTLFMNLHPTDLMDANLLDPEAALTKIASRVVLEVTERESLTPTTALLERLAALRGLGFRIAVDDIGAGYSGLTSFADLTPEVVKIDMSLVRGIHASAVKQRTVAALCALCHDMGARVVGEGVETVSEKECLVELGCDLLQGYLLGRPAELPPR